MVCKPLALTTAALLLMCVRTERNPPKIKGRLHIGRLLAQNNRFRARFNRTKAAAQDKTRGGSHPVAPVRPRLSEKSSAGLSKTSLDLFRAHIDAKIAAQPRHGQWCCETVVRFGKRYNYTAARSCSGRSGTWYLGGNPPKHSQSKTPWWGEFGHELTVIAPWYYGTGVDLKCDLNTTGLPGTKYLYYFSAEHHIKVGMRRSSSAGSNMPYGCPTHGTHEWPRFSTDEPASRVGNTPVLSGHWAPMPLRDFFGTGHLHVGVPGDDKPLLMIFNKYTMQWKQKPINFIPISTLKALLSMLVPRYRIVYVRLFNSSSLEDSNFSYEFGDIKMIRSFFPKVVPEALRYYCMLN